MSQKLQQALGALGQSIEKLKQACREREAAKPKQPASFMPPQNDLFTLAAGPYKNPNAKAMAQILDRTINRMEKLVGESR